METRQSRALEDKAQSVPWSVTCNDDSLSWTLPSHSSNSPRTPRASRYPLMAPDPLGVQESLDCTLDQMCRDQEVATDCSLQLHPNTMLKCYPGSSSSPCTFHRSKSNRLCTRLDHVLVLSRSHRWCNLWPLHRGSEIMSVFEETLHHYLKQMIWSTRKKLSICSERSASINLKQLVEKNRILSFMFLMTVSHCV